MLVLSRKLGERIVIGKEITATITVLEVRKGRVKLGVDAPPEVLVYREEIAFRIEDCPPALTCAGSL